MATVTTKPSFRHDHKFYFGVALVLAAIVFVGFAPTYYLKRFFDNSPLPLLVHIHGFVMTVWYALFITQVLLVAKDRVELQQKLGYAGIFLSAAVAVLGTAVSIGLAHRRLVANPNSTLGPAIVRLPGINDHNIPAAIVIGISLTLACIVVDTVRNKRLHPAFGWGGTLVIGSVFLFMPLAQSAAWAPFVRRMLI
ncbi:MAG: hypothetical protein NVS9B14_07440 [Candidatus Acidiferrum sp.]